MAWRVLPCPMRHCYTGATRSHCEGYVMPDREAIWPNFFIVGAGKAGTTSLYEWLKQHPQVFMSSVKEPRFFASDLPHPAGLVIRDEHEYLNLFSKASGYQAIGEATVSYFRFWRVVSDRIRRAVPNARIIILLRDPVERAYSAYLALYRIGRERRESFYEALRDSPDAPIYCQTYAMPTRAYLEAFGEQNVLVLMFERLESRPRELLAEVASFLEIDQAATTRIATSVANPGGAPRGAWAKKIFAARDRLPMHQLPMPSSSRKLLLRLLLAPKPAIDPHAVELLRPVFEKDLEELECLLRRPLPELKRVW